MLMFIFGENQSGKSRFAEEMLARADGDKGYLATLPKLRVYHQRIQRHQSRRPADWSVVELTGHLDHDARGIRQISERALLLDGLSIYLERVAIRRAGRSARWIDDIVDWLERTVLRSAQTRIVVDCVPFLPASPATERLIRVAHQRLWSCADWGYQIQDGRAVAAGAARRLQGA